jgi:tetratricopeptide (TPR) repeat protein
MKKLLMVITALVLAVFSYNVSAQGNTAMATPATPKPADNNAAKEMRNKQAAQATFQAYTANNMDAFFNSFDENFIYYSSSNKEYRGLDTMKASMAKYDQPFRAAFPDIKRTLLATATDGDYVTVWEESTGSWKGEYMGMKPNGKPFKVKSVSILKYNDNGKIISEHQITNDYQEISRQVGFYDGVEGDMNDTGYKLLAEKKFNEAIEVFKLNVKLYPNAWNTYDSLGEAYALAGNKKMAIENYEKSLKLNPKNDNGKEFLAKLKAK